MLFRVSMLGLRHAADIVASRRQVVHGCLRRGRKQAASERTRARTVAVRRSRPPLPHGSP